MLLQDLDAIDDDEGLSREQLIVPFKGAPCCFVQLVLFQIEEMFSIAAPSDCGHRRRRSREMWALVKALNGLRNELAHSLESKKREEKTRRVKDLYLKLLDNRELAATHEKESDELVLSVAGAFLIGFLGQFEAEIERFRGFVDVMDRMVNLHRHASDNGPGTANAP